MILAALNAYDAWAQAAWAASTAISVISICWACLRYNKRNHAERMRRLDIKHSAEVHRQLTDGTSE